MRRGYGLSGQFQTRYCTSEHASNGWCTQLAAVDQQTCNVAQGGITYWKPTTTTTTTTPAPSYVGCYENYAPCLITGHQDDKSASECSELARAGGKMFFGMEWPQGISIPGNAQCLVLDTSQITPMTKKPDSDCEVETNSDGMRLGGSHRLAVYSNAVWHLAPPGASACDSGVVAIRGH